MEAEMATFSEQSLRAQADYTNLRKRMDREVSESIRFSKENLIKLILPIVDDFSRSLQAMDKTDNLTAIKEGITMINNNIARVFDKIGVEAVESIGKEFDTNLHEAITSIPVDDEKQKGIVIDEIEKGYKLNQRVVRFAKVVIGE